MAKGNWSKYKPKSRCYICGYVIKEKVEERLDDHPVHVMCAARRRQIEADKAHKAKQDLSPIAR